MDQESSPPPSAAFDLNELVRLNEELKQLRESLRHKKLERDKAKAEGKRAALDLSPELLRLTRFVEELDQLREKLKSSAFAKTDREASDAEALRDVLLEMRNQLLTEKATLEEEHAAGELHEQLKREAEELRALREQLAKDKETLGKAKESLESTLTQVKEEQARLKSISAETRQEISRNERTRSKSTYDHEEAEEPGNARLDFLIDQLSIIKTELRDVREHLARQELALESKQRELEQDKYRIHEEKRAPETLVTQEMTTIKLDLEKFREQLAKEQEILETRRDELADQNEKIKEERKALETRTAEAQDDFAKRTIQRIRNELQSERVELSSLRKSIQRIKAASMRERRIIEHDKSAILRVRTRLEIERQRIAQKAALLELREERVGTVGGSERKDKPRQISTKRNRRNQERDRRRSHPVIEQLIQRKVIVGEEVILGVKLGTEHYGVNTTKVREIVRMREVTPIPRQPPYVEGVMNVRGAIIPVVNLKKRFGLQGNGSKHQHIVVVESAKGPVGILVDSVTEVIHVPARQIHPPPQVTSGINDEYLRGICTLREKLMIYLDLEKLLRQAVPISTTAELPLPSSWNSDLSELDKEEQKLLKSIPRAGRTKLNLRRRVGFSANKFDGVISSLMDKGLIEVTHVGNSKLIRRSSS
jgi:purine-binding chemotaxis protein CheW